jgi:hypothetical protein
LKTLRFDKPNCPDCSRPAIGVVESIDALAYLKPAGFTRADYEGETKVYWHLQRPHGDPSPLRTLRCDSCDREWRATDLDALPLSFASWSRHAEAELRELCRQLEAAAAEARRRAEFEDAIRLGGIVAALFRIAQNLTADRMREGEQDNDVPAAGPGKVE